MKGKGTNVMFYSTNLTHKHCNCQTKLQCWRVPAELYAIFLPYTFGQHLCLSVCVCVCPRTHTGTRTPARLSKVVLSVTRSLSSQTPAASSWSPEKEISLHTTSAWFPLTPAGKVPDKCVLGQVFSDQGPRIVWGYRHGYWGHWRLKSCQDTKEWICEDGISFIVTGQDFWMEELFSASLTFKDDRVIFTCLSSNLKSVCCRAGVVCSPLPWQFHLLQMV